MLLFGINNDNDIDEIWLYSLEGFIIHSMEGINWKGRTIPQDM